MAAITAVGPVLCSPTGYENVQHGYASANFNAGALVIMSGTPPSSRWDVSFAAATAAVAHGVVLKKVTAGGTAEVAWRGEMDGFSGLTPGAPLSVATGVLDDTAPTAAQVGTSTIRAVTPSRIRFDLT